MEDNFGKFSFNKNRATGLMYQIMNGFLHFIGVRTLTMGFVTPLDKRTIYAPYEFANLDFEQLVTLVPTLGDSFSFFMDSAFFYSIPLLVGVVLSIWIFEYRSHLDDSSFSMTRIIQISFGMSSIRNLGNLSDESFS